MKKGILKFHDKIIIAVLMGLSVLSGCCTKKISCEKTQADKKETVKNQTDSIPAPKKIMPGEVIAMYGVRPNQIKE